LVDVHGGLERAAGQVVAVLRPELLDGRQLRAVVDEVAVAEGRVVLGRVDRLDGGGAERERPHHAHHAHRALTHRPGALGPADELVDQLIAGGVGTSAHVAQVLHLLVDVHSHVALPSRVVSLMVAYSAPTDGSSSMCPSDALNLIAASDRYLRTAPSEIPSSRPIASAVRSS